MPCPPVCSFLLGSCCVEGLRSTSFCCPKKLFLLLCSWSCRARMLLFAGSCYSVPSVNQGEQKRRQNVVRSLLKSLLKSPRAPFLPHASYFVRARQFVPSSCQASCCFEAFNVVLATRRGC